MSFLTKVKYLTYGIGFYKLGEIGYDIGKTFQQEYYTPSQDLIEKYGKCYALVTGSTSGMGKEYVHQLAQRGFDIIAFGRDEQKTKDLKIEVEQLYGVQVKTYQMDFKNGDDLSKFDEMYKEFKCEDIGILVNNVGITEVQRYEHQQPQDIKDIITVNTFSQAMMINKFVNKMMNRNKKSCIITVSSESGEFPTPFHAAYAPSKAFNNALSKALEAELGEKIDFATFKPSATKTQIFEDMQAKKKGTSYFERVAEYFLLATAKDAVQSSLNNIGKGILDHRSTLMSHFQAQLWTRLGRLSTYIRYHFFNQIYQRYGDAKDSITREISVTIPPPIISNESKTEELVKKIQDEEPQLKVSPLLSSTLKGNASSDFSKTDSSQSSQFAQAPQPENTSSTSSASKETELSHPPSQGGYQFDSQAEQDKPAAPLQKTLFEGSIDKLKEDTKPKDTDPDKTFQFREETTHKFDSFDQEVAKNGTNFDQKSDFDYKTSNTESKKYKDDFGSSSSSYDSYGSSSKSKYDSYQGSSSRFSTSSESPKTQDSTPSYYDEYEKSRTSQFGGQFESEDSTKESSDYIFTQDGQSIKKPKERVEEEEDKKKTESPGTILHAFLPADILNFLKGGKGKGGSSEGGASSGGSEGVF